MIRIKRLQGELELLIGLLSLGLATLIFRVESKRLGRSEGMDQALRLLSLMTAGALAMIIAKRPEIPAQNPR